MSKSQRRQIAKKNLSLHLVFILPVYILSINFFALQSSKSFFFFPHQLDPPLSSRRKIITPQLRSLTFLPPLLLSPFFFPLSSLSLDSLFITFYQPHHKIQKYHYLRPRFPRLVLILRGPMRPTLSPCAFLT